MTSDIKLSHYFLLIKVKSIRILNNQIIQKKISKHHPLCECRKTSTVEYISLQNVFIFIFIFMWISRFTAIMSQCRGNP